MATNLKSVIQLHDLTKDFGELRAVDGVSLNIHEGEILGFLGPNGAGKTTTINMICGLLPPTKGRIDFLFQDTQNGQEPRNRIGICPQENIFWPRLTCLEQMKFMGRVYRIPAREALDSAERLLADMGLTEKSTTLASKLSGGMKRRLNIALALIHDPDILVLDEPEAGLDPQSRILVRDFVRTLAHKKTVILTTHNMDEADRMADRVAIIDRGRLQIVDDPEALKRSLGEGDTLEIQVDQLPSEKLQESLQALIGEKGEVQILERGITIRALNLIDHLNDISTRIRESGGVVRQMSLRENTLEDVFISLTGRQLRQ